MGCLGVYSYCTGEVLCKWEKRTGHPYPNTGCQPLPLRLTFPLDHDRYSFSFPTICINHNTSPFHLFAGDGVHTSSFGD